jgi:glycosyltransferase involved in cell wall biosynthesis
LKDVLLITWHGIHELDIFPGLPDTGGQNIYVQNMARQIHDLCDCRVIILNRGGFTHPYTERMREGMSKDPDRELYVLHVGDDIKAFVRKEYLTGALIENAVDPVLHQLPGDFKPELVISHFWDGGLLGDHLCRHFTDAVHVWVPHEPVGMKKAPLSEAQQEKHGIFRRERYEERVLDGAHLVGSTSKLVWDDLQSAHGRDWTDKLIDIYPGVDTERFCPMQRDVITGKQARSHAEFTGLPAELFRRQHICEFGRSDSLKDKDQAVEAFALVAREIDDLVMFLNLDETMEPGIAEKIRAIIERENLHDRIHIFSPRELPQNGVGSTILPNLLRTSKAFLTMSVMEGFGMAACEAAACGVPVVGTEHIPVVTDVIAPAGGGTVVPGKDPRAAADAVLHYLRLDDDAWHRVADKAHASVIPKYTWEQIIRDMFRQMEAKGHDLDLPC